MADEGVDHTHNPTSESTFQGAPSASGVHASPSPTTTTLPTPDPAAATSTPITTLPMAEGTGFTGMPTNPRGVVYRVYSGTMIVTVYRYTGIQVYRVYR